jgi:hypothetical protein
MRAANLCLKLGATMRANTVFVFQDDLIINFIYAVTGLKNFDSEFQAVRHLNWIGLRRVPILRLERIYHSKSVIRRPKDIAHMQLLKQLIVCEKRITRNKRPPKPTATKTMVR